MTIAIACNISKIYYIKTPPTMAGQILTKNVPKTNVFVHISGIKSWPKHNNNNYERYFFAAT